ncbi:unnamed protein product [Didymodactylos carnosus]|uniref:TIR domain-containing protein n=1 Tax=Didymodactylos carnosus TaxID=1234261 RepID=A0A814Y6Y8_9BILA|nr:unnamed protein product [Didymodactylos carnosus]CAF1224948.1 unnamed protein product [Didymodactylos carnosus]CAF3856937.1 unnamed protein product [Didymodactylos carnosus]CAF3987941.1 unnamed protein product [Didymodactylos carnosus]
MAEGVENALCIVCFLSPGYQESVNCKKELTYAEQLRIPILPCIMVPNWKPTQWLGLCVSDLLYLRFGDLTEADLESKCSDLIAKIKQIVGDEKLALIQDSSNIKLEECENQTREQESGDDIIDAMANIDFSAKIPPPKRQGPEILQPSEIAVKKYVCEGDSAIRLLNGPNNKVECNQDCFTSNGAFINYFFIPKIMFQNTSKEPATVIYLTGEYQDRDGVWQEVEQVLVGPPTANGNYTWLPDTVINLDSSRVVTYAVRIDIRVEGNTGIDNQRRARAHRKLPQPLKIRLTVQDTEGKQSNLIVEQVNSPLRLPTREALLKQWSHIGEVIGFVYVDDCEEDSRYFTLVYLDSKFRLCLAIGDCLSLIQTPVSWDRKQIKSLQKEAKILGQTEITLKEMDQYGGIHKALFDSDTFTLYAVNIELTSKTSKTEEPILIPLNKVR